MDFNGCVVVVTGASSGVGEACAKLFSSLGAKVVLAARTVSDLERVASGLPNEALVCPTDVADSASCQQLIDKTMAQFGHLDILVNNAGFNSRGEVIDMSLDAMERIIDINLKAPMRLSRLALPHLLKANQASIVNVASLAGRFPLDGEASYSASKFGLRAFSLALAEELDETAITVSLVSPGPIKTGFIMDEIDEVPDLVFSQPMSSAEQVAQAVKDSVVDGKRERAIPVSSGILATTAYLMPGLRKGLRPVLEAKGRKIKAKYQNKV